MQLKHLLIIPFLTTSLCSFGQEKFTVSGFLKDKNNGETLIGATVYVKELQTGAAANAYGFYSLSLPKGTYTLQYSFIGYLSTEETIALNTDIVKTVELAPQNIQLETVVISSKKKDENVTRTQMSVVKMDPKILSTMGDYDFVPSVLTRCGVDLLFDRVAVQPGKPTTFGKTDSGKMVFGLPGNPVSSFAQFELLVRPALEKMMGEKPKELFKKMRLSTDYHRKHGAGQPSQGGVRRSRALRSIYSGWY